MEETTLESPLPNATGENLPMPLGVYRNLTFGRKRQSFPKLDASGDQFQNWVNAAQSYVDEVNEMTPSNTFMVESVTTGLTASAEASYRFSGFDIDSSGNAICFPASQPRTVRLDTNSKSFDTIDHPTTSFTNVGSGQYWGNSFDTWNESIWCPINGYFYGVPSYARRIVMYNAQLDDFKDFEVPNSGTLAGYRRGVYFDGLIYMFNSGGSVLMKIDPEDDSITRTTGLSSIFGRWVVGPDSKFYTINRTNVRIFNPSDNTASTIASGFTATETTAGMTVPVLAANGKFYSMPSRGNSSETDYLVEFDPATENVNLIDLEGDATATRRVRIPSGADRFTHGTLLPDGRIAFTCDYNWQRWNGSSWTNTWAPCIFNPYTSRFEVGNYLLSGPGQWGFHRNPVIGAKGNLFPAPYRIMNSGGRGFNRYMEDSSLEPPPEFFAHTYKT